MLALGAYFALDARKKRLFNLFNFYPGTAKIIEETTMSFMEDIQFKDFDKAATYHDPEDQKKHDIPKLIERLFKIKPELLDIMEYKIMESTLDSSGNRGRVKVQTKVHRLNTRRFQGCGNNVLFPQEKRQMVHGAGIVPEKYLDRSKKGEEHWKRRRFKRIRPRPAIGPYSQAVSAGPFLFVSGQLGLIPETGEMAGPDLASQARQGPDESPKHSGSRRNKPFQSRGSRCLSGRHRKLRRFQRHLPGIFLRRQTRARRGRGQRPAQGRARGNQMRRHGLRKRKSPRRQPEHPARL